MVRLGRPISTIPPELGGARHFASDPDAHQWVLNGNYKQTTSHPVTTCRNEQALARQTRALATLGEFLKIF